MSTYILGRIAAAIPTVLGLTLLVFLLLRVALPTDAAELVASDRGQGDPRLTEQLREDMGLSGSMPAQYAGWLWDIARGDLGTSFYTGRSVRSELARRVPTSLELGLGALLITIVVGIPIGILSAVRQDSSIDYLVRGTAILAYAVPGFWAATLVLVYGSRYFGWAPPIDYQPIWEDPVANLKQMFAPMLLLSLQPTGRMARLVRTQVLEVLRDDYVRTARAKGLRPIPIYGRHVLRNAMIPIVTVIGLQVPGLLAGSVVFEQIFVLPGVGAYLLTAVSTLDYQVVLATNLLFGVILVTANIVVDASYGFIDPRIRLR